MPFSILQLRFAIPAADHGSFHRAALALEIDPSTLSRNILKLERVIGTKLFIRSRAGVTTTVAGAGFIRDARPILASSDRLVAAMRAAGQGCARRADDRPQQPDLGRQSARHGARLAGRASRC